MKEPSDVVQRIDAAPRTGQWHLEDDGTLSFRRVVLDWHELRDESECFFLRVYGPGDYRFKGADLGVLVTKGRLQTDEPQLTERCRRLMGMRARSASSTRRQAAPSSSDQLPEGIVVLTRRRLLSFPRPVRPCGRGSPAPAPSGCAGAGRRTARPSRPPTCVGGMKATPSVVQRLRPACRSPRAPSPSRRNSTTPRSGSRISSRCGGRLDQRPRCPGPARPPPRSPRGRRRRRTPRARTTAAGRGPAGSGGRRSRSGSTRRRPVVDDVEVGGVLGVRRPGQLRVAVQQRAAVERA